MFFKKKKSVESRVTLEHKNMFREFLHHKCENVDKDAKVDLHRSDNYVASVTFNGPRQNNHGRDTILIILHCVDSPFDPSATMVIYPAEDYDKRISIDLPAKGGDYTLMKRFQEVYHMKYNIDYVDIVKKLM